MQPPTQMAAIAPPNSYSYGQPDQYYPQNSLSDSNPPPPALGRASPPPGRFYDPRGALVANELGSAGSPPSIENIRPGQTSWERNGDFASISREASTNRPSNTRLEAIAGMPVNDGTQSYSPLNLNNSGRTPRSDVADRYGTRRGYGAPTFATRSNATGTYAGDSLSNNPGNNGNSALRGMRGGDSRDFNIGGREEDAERR